MDALLDSAFIIDVLRGRPTAGKLLRALEEEGRVLAIPAPAFFEVRTGLLHRQARAQAMRFAASIERFPVIPFDEGAARRASEIQADALRSGGAHGDVDVMIASMALEADAELVTADGGFDDLEAAYGLRVRWY